MKRLIINADDFGLHHSINEAVEVAYNKGVLTSASLVVNGEAFDQALNIAKRNEGLGVGVHLTLIGERPVATAARIPSLLNERGNFFEDHGEVCKRILLGKISLEHIAIECGAQIEKFLRVGLFPTHVDSHRHLHLFPPVFRALTPVFKQYGITKVRWLNVPGYDYSGVDLKKLIFLVLARSAVLLGADAYRHPDYFIGFFKSGAMDADYVKRAVAKIKEGATEINFHPAKDNAQVSARYGFWRNFHDWDCGWEKEFRALLDPALKEIIATNNITLINYSQL